MAEQPMEAICECGARIVQVHTLLKGHEYWRLVDSGEVATGGHWHRPARGGVEAGVYDLTTGELAAGSRAKTSVHLENPALPVAGEGIVVLNQQDPNQCALQNPDSDRGWCCQLDKGHDGDHVGGYQMEVRWAGEGIAKRPIAQGGDYRPHYRKREADAYMDFLAARVVELEKDLRGERASLLAKAIAKSRTERAEKAEAEVAELRKQLKEKADA